MNRLKFLQNIALGVAVVYVPGFLKVSPEGKVTGDCETTTDILGPYYRPGAPMRSNLLMENYHGEILMLSGKVIGRNCNESLNSAEVEIWHCDENGVYDNESEEFRYRGKVITEANGLYAFTTVIPIPYKTNPKSENFRPAHIHMRISAPGYQDLITQIYFTGDPYLETDEFSASPKAKTRILSLTEEGMNIKKVVFNINMMESLPLEESVLNKLIGEYKVVENPFMKIKIFRRDNAIWIESPDGEDTVYYGGNNTLIKYGCDKTYFKFQITENDKVKIFVNYDCNGDKFSANLEKIK